MPGHVKKKPRRTISSQSGSSFGNRVRSMFGVGSDSKLDKIKRDRKRIKN